MLSSLKRSLKHLKEEISLLEGKLLSIVKTEHQELLIILESIPGLGRKTSLMLIVLTDGFNHFESAVDCALILVCSLLLGNQEAV